MVEDFIFDGIALSDFGYILTSDSIQDETTPVSNITFVDIKAGRSEVSHLVDTNYEQNYTRTIQIMKDPCLYFDADSYLTNYDISEISKWLCRKEYKYFRWVDDIGQDEIWYEVYCNVNKIEYGGNVIGLEITITSNRPYALTREYQYTLEQNSGTTSIQVHSDEDGYIYPNMVIHVINAGQVQITNQTENRTTTINNCTNGEIITLVGGDTLQISSSNTEHDMSKNFNYVFPRFQTGWGFSKNQIGISSNCEVEISYRGIRKVGL